MTDDTLFPNFGQLTATAPDWEAKRPVRIVLMGDFSAGAAAGRLETGEDLARRKLLPIDFDSFEDVLERLDVRLALPLGSDGGVELEFSNDLDDFHPDELYDNVEVFEELYNLSGRLSNSSTAAEVLSWSTDRKHRVSRSGRNRSRSGTPAADAKLSDLAQLVGKATEVDTDGDIDELVRSIVGPFVQPADAPNVGSLTESVNEALSDAMRAVLHNSEFQNLESLWRGLDMLVHRVDTSPRLQLLLLDMSAEEFAADLSKVDDLSESGLESVNGEALELQMATKVAPQVAVSAQAAPAETKPEAAAETSDDDDDDDDGDLDDLMAGLDDDDDDEMDPELAALLGSLD